MACFDGLVVGLVTTPAPAEINSIGDFFRELLLQLIIGFLVAIVVAVLAIKTKRGRAVSKKIWRHWLDWCGPHGIGIKAVGWPLMLIAASVGFALWEIRIGADQDTIEAAFVGIALGAAAKLIYDLGKRTTEVMISRNLVKSFRPLVQFQGTLAEFNRQLLDSPTKPDAEDILRQVFDEFFIAVGSAFDREPNRKPVEELGTIVPAPKNVGIAIFRVDPKNGAWLSVWEHRDVSDVPPSLWRFYIGPTANQQKNRGLAGSTYVDGKTEVTNIIERTGKNEHNPPTYICSNPKFRPLGTNGTDPGFRSLITVAVPKVDATTRAVLCISADRTNVFRDPEAVKIAEDLGRILAVPIMLYDQV